MKGLTRWGVSYINRMLPTALAPGIIFFIAAGNLRIPGGWIFFGLYFAIHAANILFLLITNVELLNARGETKPDVRETDRLLMLLYLLSTHLLAPLAAGLEYRLHPGLSSPPSLVITGVALMLLSLLIECWAMASNTHFERNVRIQNDRGHAVVSTGPYRTVRHPGYLAYLLRYAAFPLVLGGWFALPFVLAGMIVFIVRKAYEDRLLTAELQGYREYRARVKWRLLPFVW